MAKIFVVNTTDSTNSKLYGYLREVFLKRKVSYIKIEGFNMRTIEIHATHEINYTVQRFMTELGACLLLSNSVPDTYGYPVSFYTPAKVRKGYYRIKIKTPNENLVLTERFTVTLLSADAL
jgi:hypothetical protein